MQQVTLNIPTDKMPVFRQFLQVAGLENNDNNIANVLPGNFNRETPAPSKFHPYYDWEFFMSELEYE
jgi:hypothetical protein